MVDKETVRLMAGLAVLPEGGGDCFALLTGVDKNQTLFVPCVLENVADAGVGVFRCSVCLFRQCRRRWRVRFLGGSLFAVDEKVLHGQPPAHAFCLNLGGGGAPAGAEGEKCAHTFRVADGGGQTDAPWIDVRHAGEPLNQTEGLPSTVATDEGVDLVDDNEAQVMEQLRNRRMLAQQQRLQRFRRDLEDARGMLQHLRLVGLGHIAVPVPDGNVRFLAQLVQPLELVVDEGFQRPDVDRSHRGRGIFAELGENGEERCLCLSRSGGRTKQQVVVGVENDIAGGDLNRTEGFPVVLIDIVLQKRRIAVKNGHGKSSLRKDVRGVLTNVRIFQTSPRYRTLQIPAQPPPHRLSGDGRRRSCRTGAAEPPAAADSGIRCPAAR